MPDLLYPDVHLCCGKLVEAPWQKISELQQTGQAFLVALIGIDPISQKMAKVLDSFVTHRSPDFPIIKVDLTGPAASELGVSLVPQLRVYKNGSELSRHHGFASYSVLSTLVQSLE